MARPVKPRRVCAMPAIAEFAPLPPCAGQVEMAVDEYETIRLIDHLGLSQEECAAQMGVARTTAQAVYGSARRKLADALVNGKRLLIQGGSYDLCPKAHSCPGKPCCRRRCQMQSSEK